MRETLCTVFRSRGFLTFAFCFLFLAGCASQQPVSEQAKENAWKQRLLDISALREWELAGRMSVRLEDEGWSASLFWRQDHQDFSVRIVAPLGRGSVEVSGNPDAVQLRTMENQVLEDDDVDLLMRENLGWSIPVRSLGYWIKGLPEPGGGPETLVLDERGRITDLRQSNWQISYEDYTRVDGHEIPSRITLQREGLTLRLRINRWDFTT